MKTPKRGRHNRRPLTITSGSFIQADNPGFLRAQGRDIDTILLVRKPDFDLPSGPLRSFLVNIILHKNLIYVNLIYQLTGCLR
ncbi:hypothetical protein S100072_00284 [Bacillus velezensis]|nr:hypothetical protein S100072_00284 [Bacillus velezensis]